MSDLPTLVKPYYSIEEAFNRLKLAGASLDKPEDLLLLAHRGMIDVKLLCDVVVGLIPVDSVEIEFINIPAEYENEDLLSRQGSKEAFDSYIAELNFSAWILTYKNHKFKYPARVDGIQCPVLIKPMDLFGESREQPLIIQESKWLLTSHPRLCQEFHAVVEEEGVLYYVCERIAETPPNMAQYSIKQSQGKLIDPDYSFRLDGKVITNLIKKRNFAITKEAILTFEQIHLGIDKGIHNARPPAYLDPDNQYYANELAIAIEAHTAIFINGEGNKHKAVGERVKTWVCEHYPKESKSGAFVERISSVVLPKK